MKEENNTPGINQTKFYMVFKDLWFDRGNQITIEPVNDCWEYTGTVEELEALINRARELGADEEYLKTFKIIPSDNQQVKK